MSLSMFTCSGEVDDDDKLTLSQLLGHHSHIPSREQGEPRQDGVRVSATTSQGVESSRPKDTAVLVQSVSGPKRPCNAEALPSSGSPEPAQKRRPLMVWRLSFHSAHERLIDCSWWFVQGTR